MLDGFGDAEEHQPDAHPGAEEHGEPGQIAIVGLALVGPEFDLAVSAEHQIDDEHQETGDRGNVEPAEIRDDRRLEPVEQQCCGLREHRTEDGEQQDQSGRDVEDRRIDLNSRALLQWRGFLQNGIGQGIFLLVCDILFRTQPRAVGCRQVWRLV